MCRLDTQPWGIKSGPRAMHHAPAHRSMCARGDDLMHCSGPAPHGVGRRSQSSQATTIKKQRPCVNSTHCFGRQISMRIEQAMDRPRVRVRIQQEESAGRCPLMLVVVCPSRGSHSLPPRPACVDSTQRAAHANAFEGRRSRYSSTPHVDGNRCASPTA